MSDFDFPSNIKQIGNIGEGLMIYVEDYAFTYLKQYSQADGERERVAFLVGRYIVIDSQPFIFISGAIQGRYSEQENGAEVFTQKSYDYAAEQIEKFFSGHEIIGWMQTQPGYGTALNPEYLRYHKNNFKRHYNVQFVMDPAERTNAFYVWDGDMGGLTESTGYFIYYDKNHGMQDYMMENRIVKGKDKLLFDDFAEYEPEGKEAYGYGKTGKQKTDYRKPRARERGGTEYKRVVNMLVSLSAVLFIICFIMGAGLIQNDSRINKMEKQVLDLRGSYNYIAGAVNQDGTQSVFAGQNPDGESGASVPETASYSAETPETAVYPWEQTYSLPPPENTAAPAASVTATSAPIPVTAITPVPARVQAIPGQADGYGLYADGIDWLDIYTVQEGDNLWLINYKFYGEADRIQDIMEANGMTDPDTIYYGRELKIPR